MQLARKEDAPTFIEQSEIKEDIMNQFLLFVKEIVTMVHLSHRPVDVLAL